MGVATTLAPKDLGPKNLSKKLAHVGVLLGHMISQNHAPEISDPGPPSLNLGVEPLFLQLSPQYISAKIRVCGSPCSSKRIIHNY